MWRKCFLLTAALITAYLALMTKPAATPAIQAVPSIDKQAVISALTTDAQLIGLTGAIEKELTVDESEWYGAKRYDFRFRGEFTFGIDTADIDVSVQSERVVIDLPPVRLLTLSVPFDEAVIRKQVGWSRKPLTDEELQAVYHNATTAVRGDLASNIELQNKAQSGVEQAIRKLLAPVAERGTIEFE